MICPSCTKPMRETTRVWCPTCVGKAGGAAKTPKKARVARRSLAKARTRRWKAGARTN